MLREITLWTLTRLALGLSGALLAVGGFFIRGATRSNEFGSYLVAQLRVGTVIGKAGR